MKDDIQLLKEVLQEKEVTRDYYKKFQDLRYLKKYDDMNKENFF